MNLTPNEVLIIALVALVVLGPQRLPEAARKIGQGYRELRKMSTSVRAEIDSALKEPIDAIKKPLDEFKTTLNESATGVATPDSTRGAAPSGSQGSVRGSDAVANAQEPDLPNSAFRPADELPPDTSPADDAGSGDAPRDS